MDLVVVLTFFFLLPEGQVLLEELNDGLGITEIILLKFIDLLEGILESLVSELTGSLVVLHDFVVEDREVKSKSELNWVAWWEDDLVGFLVGLEGAFLNLIELGGLGVLGDVSVVVTDHLHEECLWLTLAGLGENLIVDHGDDLLTVLGELILNARFV